MGRSSTIYWLTFALKPNEHLHLSSRVLEQHSEILRFQYYVQYWFTIDGNRTEYGKRFMSDLGIAAQTPNFLAGLINVMQIIGFGSLQRAITWIYYLESITSSFRGSLMIRIAGPLTVNCINVAIILVLIVAQDPAEEGRVPSRTI